MPIPIESDKNTNITQFTDGILKPGGLTFAQFGELLLTPNLDRTVVRGIIEKIIGDESTLAKIAKDSYRHELGFDKIQLMRDFDTDCIVRLHLWHPEAMGESNIHSHGRSFTSKVVTGGIENYKWEVNDKEGQPFYHHRYGVTNRRTTVEDLGLTMMKQVSKDIHTAGTTYGMHSSELHTTGLLPGEPTSTIFVMSPHESNVSDVYTISESIGSGVTHPSFTAEELRAILTDYSTVLATPSA